MNELGNYELRPCNCLNYRSGFLGEQKKLYKWQRLVFERKIYSMSVLHLVFGFSKRIKNVFKLKFLVLKKLSPLVRGHT